ncbi:MAG: type IV secretion system DNA-binding domain-containing protein [Chthonomonas sp.]|nr:type IV secretion system DNA-binding domain-containing protein [Chthonomonas sp.]
MNLTDFIEFALAKMACRTNDREPTGPSSPSPGFLLGHDPVTHSPVHLHLKDRRKHLYVVGASGCGKTNLLLRLLDDDVNENRNAIVIDLRGDLVDRVIKRLAPERINGNQIHLLDFRNEVHAVPFNPLVGPGNAYRRALHLLEIIKESSPSWGVQLEETIRFCLIALAESHGSILDVELLLTDGGFRSKVLGKCRDEQTLRFFARFSRLSPSQQTTLTLPVLNKLSPFWSVPHIRQTLSSRQSLEWGEWIDRKGHIVLIALAAHSYPGLAQTIGGLIVASIQEAVMARADQPQGSRVPITLYLDEFETMATPTFSTIIAEGRRFGLSLLLAHQNIAQIESRLRQTILGNVQTSLYFQCSAHDATQLARDIVTPIQPNVLRQKLSSSPVGVAFLNRRGKPSTIVATFHEPDPELSEDELRERKHILQIQKKFVPRKALNRQEVRHERRPFI